MILIANIEITIELKQTNEAIFISYKKKKMY